MPEGPEVRKYADSLHEALSGRPITSLTARTRDARAWLQDHETRLVGQRVERVVSHGKHLIGYIEANYYFHSHLMMWGRWQTVEPTITRTPRKKPAATLILPEKDRRERARIVVEGGAAILLSAPIFNVGEGDPYEHIENLRSLGPDALPYDSKFDARELRRRLRHADHLDITIGAALLNQRIVAGLGNYLRAEILFACRVNPWRKVGDLTKQNLSCLVRAVPEVTRRAYEHSATASDDDRRKMAGDSMLVYQAGREYGTRHLVFRRTNLPCLRCGEAIRQLRQKTFNPDMTEEDEVRTRIMYFCARCQNVDVNSVTV